MLFHAQLLISALLAVPCVFGAPNTKRQDSNPCNGLGNGAYSDLTTFRVAALKINGTNDHPYGDELYLGTTGVVIGASSRALTVGSWDANPKSSNLAMASGGITAAPPEWDVATQVPDNEMPFFFVSGATPRPPPATVWCGVPSNEVTGEHNYHYLAAHGHYDLWSLCYKKYSETVGYYRVAYNVDKTKTTFSFDVDTCVPIYLTIVS